MTNLNSPEHVLDLQNTLISATIESASPGQKIDVLVYLENDPARKSVRAVGLRSTDGGTFEVSVPTPNGDEKHSWSWWIRENALKSHRPK